MRPKLDRRGGDIHSRSKTSKSGRFVSRVVLYCPRHRACSFTGLMRVILIAGRSSEGPRSVPLAHAKNRSRHTAKIFSCPEVALPGRALPCSFGVQSSFLYTPPSRTRAEDANARRPPGEPPSLEADADEMRLPTMGRICPVWKWSEADVGSPANPGCERDLGSSAHGTGVVEDANALRLCVREPGGVTGAACGGVGVRLQSPGF